MSGEVTLITGVSRPTGLGIAVARQLAQRGHHVIVTARDESAAQDCATALQRDGLSVGALPLDLMKSDQVPIIAKGIADRHGRLDVLVNNAGTMPDMRTRSVLDADITQVRRALEEDVLGPWALVQALRPLLEAAPAGRIVNLSSGVAEQITSDEPDIGAPAHAFGEYSAEVLNRLLARAFTGSRVLVNAVDPGRVDTHPELGTDPEDVAPNVAAATVVKVATLPENGPSVLCSEMATLYRRSAKPTFTRGVRRAATPHWPLCRTALVNSLRSPSGPVSERPGSLASRTSSAADSS